MKVYNNFLNQDECDLIINHINNLGNSRRVHNHNRNIELYRVMDYDGLEFLVEKLNSIGIINKPIFNINKYKKGFYFLPHIDRGGIYDRELKRIKTFVINLSNPSTYQGGNLLVDGKVISNQQGTATEFDSGIIHEVTKIKEGERYSLIIWIEPNNIKNFTSII